jgi:outer membrane lipoprotein-sorting protein
MQAGFIVLLGLILVTFGSPDAAAQDAGELVRESFNYFRGETSVSLVDMTVHRPDWERVMTIKAWTRGEDESLFRIVAPPKDKGNGTLKKGREMWMYNPKVNRVIKIPPSMMSQAWMGSDFSNNDLAKSDSLIRDYRHTIAGTATQAGKKVYLIKSMPKPAAPVVWGMQKLKIREDHIFLEQVFYDEDLQPVKAMTAYDIRILGGRLFPGKWKMQKSGAGDEYTLLEYRELAFDRPLPDRQFSLSALRRPGR